MVSEGTIDTARRSFLRAAAGFIGLAAGIGDASAARVAGGTPTKESEDLIEAIRHRLSHAALTKILEQFHSAPTGTLTLYYQLFWPIFLGKDRLHQGMEVVHGLARLCKEKRSAKARYERWHRIRVLPAVAAAHALGLPTTAEDAEELQDFIVRTHQTALDPEDDPHREVLEIIWQNMTAALIRNRGNWIEFRAGSNLIAQAEAVCHSFLAGEMVLLRPAVAAWQFLLTYERALRERGDTANRTVVRAACARVAQRDDPHFAWLRELGQLYVDQRYSDFRTVLPQVNEVVMGRQRFSQAAVDFFILERLQSTYYNHLTAEGKLSALYIPVERAKAAEKGSLNFLANFGVTPDDWPRLKSLAERQHLFVSGDDTTRYLDHQFREYRKSFSRSKFEKRERDTVWLLNQVPFRELDEEDVSRIVYPTLHSGEAPTADKLTAETVTAFWIGVAQFVAQRQLPTRNQTLPKEVVHTVDGQVANLLERYNEEREFLRDCARDLSRTTTWGVPSRSPKAVVAEYFPDRGEETMSDVPEKEIEVADRELTEAKLIAKEVMAEFRELTVSQSTVIKLFEDAFVYRSQLRELPEAEGYDAGLRVVLSALMRVIPPNAYLEDGFIKGEKAKIDPVFEKAFAAAIHHLSRNRPRSLVVLKENAEEDRVPVSSYFRALLIFYSRNKEAFLFPY